MDTEPPPLVVDLDGTLTPTDTLWESLIRLAKTQPSSLLKLPLWFLGGRANLKERTAENIKWSGEGIPFNEEFHSYLREQKQLRRRLILATAANSRIAETVAGNLGLFDEVIASSGDTNLKGEKKLEAIRARVGPRFAYAGDSTADMPIWSAAEQAIVVGGSRSLSAKVARTTSLEREFDSPGADLLVWLSALRVHQWLKNLLVFVPLLTSFSLFDGTKVVLALSAFLGFSLAASATYILNDLWDLDNDRAHPTKRFRPLASARVRIPEALRMAFLLMTLAFLVAAVCNFKFALLLGAYVALTSIYSWWLKRFVIADVLTLASLYTTRIIAGAVVINVEVSSWLLAFSGFLFFGLAIIKRCAELVVLADLGKLGSTGRNYKVSDLAVLWPIGTSASIASVVVFGLFINSPETMARYASPQFVWVAALGLTYWLGRLWIKTARGEMHHDPLVFAARDKNSFITVAIMVLAVLIAYFVNIDF